MYGLGGGIGGHISEHRVVNGTMHRTEQCARDHCLFRTRVVVIVAPFHKGGDPIGAHIPLLVTVNIFLQFSPILQPACLHRHSPCIEILILGCKSGGLSSGQNVVLLVVSYRLL